MSITTIEAQFVFALATVINNTTLQNNLPQWPIRWPNEAFVVGLGGVLALTTDNSPAYDGIAGPKGSPAPFVEAEVILGHDGACIAPAGQRQSFVVGSMRVYLVAPLGSGRAAVNLLSDAVHDTFKRATVYDAPPERLTTIDPSIDDGVAEHIAQTNVRIDAAVPAPWKGDRFVRMVRVPFYFDYVS